MKRSATLFLQAAVLLIAIGTLGLLLWEPQIEGRNAHATQFEIYFHDPFLVYAYTAAVPVFVGYCQAFVLLRHLRQNNRQASVTALRTIRYCATAVAAF